QRGRRLEAGEPLEYGRARRGRWYVAGLHRHVPAQRLAPDGVLDDRDELVKSDGTAAAHVDDLIGRARIVALGEARAEPDDGLDRIVDIGEIAHLLAGAVDLDRFARDDVAGEPEQRHVGTTPGAIDREQAHHGRRQAVEVGVAEGDRFGRLLGGGIERERLIGVVPLFERLLAIGSVDGAGGGDQEMAGRLPAQRFQKIEAADYVGVDVGARIFGAVADAGLRREMDDDLGLRLGHLLSGELRVLEHHLARRKAGKSREYLV